MYSVVAKHMFTPRTHFILQHDHGYADNILMGNGAVGQARWFGVNTHLYQDVLHDLSIGVRGEWFRDRDGFRVYQPGRISAGTNGNPGAACIALRSMEQGQVVRVWRLPRRLIIMRLLSVRIGSLQKD